MSLPVSIDTMKSTINRRGGIARGNRFGVYINHPSRSMNSLLNFNPATLLSNLISGQGVNAGDFIQDPRDMFLLCQSCTMPGKRILTTEATHNHHNTKKPYSAATDEVTMTFLLTNDYYIKKYFDMWQEMIVDTRKEHYKTFYSSSTCGVFGAATASSYILNVNNDKKSFTENLKNSLNLATMTSSGIWQCRNGEGEAKQYALANASKCGVTAAYMAQHDSKAPIDMIEGELGFLKGYAEKIEYNELIKEENIHLINEISNKPWPACRHSHPVIGVSLYIKQKAAKKNVTFDEIEKIEIETYSTAIEFCDKKEPKNNIEGKFSLQHCCALSLIYGKIIDEYFNISYLEKIEVKNIINKIKIVENKKMSKNFPRNYSASINVKFKNGLSIKKINIHAKGDPENPMTEKEICDKSFNLIESKIDAKHDVNLLIEKILNSNEENDTSNIKWFDDLQKIINKKEY